MSGEAGEALRVLQQGFQGLFGGGAARPAWPLAGHPNPHNSGEPDGSVTARCDSTVHVHSAYLRPVPSRGPLAHHRPTADGLTVNLGMHSRGDGGGRGRGLLPMRSSGVPTPPEHIVSTAAQLSRLSHEQQQSLNQLFVFYEGDGSRVVSGSRPCVLQPYTHTHTLAISTPYPSCTPPVFGLRGLHSMCRPPPCAPAAPRPHPQRGNVAAGVGPVGHAGARPLRPQAARGVPRRQRSADAARSR